MRHLPLIAGAALCLVVPVLAPMRKQQRAADRTAAAASRAFRSAFLRDVAGGGRRVRAARSRTSGRSRRRPRRARPTDACCSAARRQRKKGVWLPAGGGPVDRREHRRTCRSSRGRRRVLADRVESTSSSRTRAASRRVCTRQFLTPYGVEFVELPELQRIYIFDIGGPHTYRTIYMDGRSHPANADAELLRPLDRLVGRRHAGRRHGRLQRGLLARSPRLAAHRAAAHARALHAHGRRDACSTKCTIDDPGAYTEPWTSGFNLRWEDGTELFEYVCQQANYAHELMVGSNDSVDRRSPIVP